MIPKNHRGITGNEIALLRRSRNRKKLQFGILWWGKRSPQAAFSRIAISVSAQHVPKAVARNRIRRKIQTLIAPLLFDFDSPHDIFIRIESASLPDTENIRREVKSALRIH